MEPEALRPETRLQLILLHKLRNAQITNFYWSFKICDGSVVLEDARGVELSTGSSAYRFQQVRPNLTDQILDDLCPDMRPQRECRDSGQSWYRSDTPQHAWQIQAGLNQSLLSEILFLCPLATNIGGGVNGILHLDTARTEMAASQKYVGRDEDRDGAKMELAWWQADRVAACSKEGHDGGGGVWKRDSDATRPRVFKLRQSIATRLQTVDLEVRLIPNLYPPLTSAVGSGLVLRPYLSGGIDQVLNSAENDRNVNILNPPLLEFQVGEPPAVNTKHLVLSAER
ncbi:hypothetical protein C8R48DRAFT_670738 [Suillus tomentosus]|nr:hypothetical protein C8R48DRAFT_670738 [Suillus tomentosus]